jgi:hypothetical protein
LSVLGFLIMHISLVAANTTTIEVNFCININLFFVLLRIVDPLHFIQLSPDGSVLLLVERQYLGLVRVNSLIKLL